MTKREPCVTGADAGRARWCGGVGALAMILVLLGGGIAPARGVDSIQGSTPAALAPTPAPDWREPDPSVRESPNLVARAVGKKQKVRVASVVLKNGKPRVVVRTARGQVAAQQEVAEAQQDSGLLAVAIDSKVRIELTNDPGFAYLWAMPLLGVEEAWQVSTGAGSIVAVIDTGVDGGHEDLQGALVPGKTSRVGDLSPPTFDTNGHGTHVAGIIAARSNNGKGIVGIAPDSKVMPIKALDADGLGKSSDLASGILWAVDHNADVLNLSVSSGRSAVIKSAIEYALAKDVVVVAAAGNSGVERSAFPAAYPGVVSVSALKKSGTALASFSNRGTNVDIAAPGRSILSTSPGGYVARSGTSMAAPQVAGTAALLRAKDPDSDVHSLLAATATDLGPRGYDSTFSHGRLNIMAALTFAAQPLIRSRQRIQHPDSVKVGRKRRLAKHSRQGVGVKRWTSRRPRICQVISNGSKWKVRGKRKGRCVVRVVVPRTGEYLRLSRKFKIRVR